jgi:hypothetical protein
MTYIDRLRGVVAGEDDYFSDDLLLFYLNKSVRDIVSYYTKYEIDADKSLHVLDNLRHTQDYSVYRNEEKTNYVKGITSLIDLTKILYLSYNEVTPMKMISVPESYQLNVGQTIPTKYESYYSIVSNFYDEITVKFEIAVPITNPDIISLNYDGGSLAGGELSTGAEVSDIVDILYDSFDSSDFELTNKGTDSISFRSLSPDFDVSLVSFSDDLSEITSTNTVKKSSFKDLVLYLYEVPTSNINLTYIDIPKDIELTDETYYDLPERVDNAIIYNACYNMIMQENVGDVQNTKGLEFKKIANEYINTNLY